MTARKATAPKTRPKYYKRVIKAADADDLEAAASHGLQDEVWLLRAYIRRVVEMADASGETSLGQAILALDKLGTAAMRLGRLLMTQQSLGKEQDEFSAALNQALEDVIADLRGERP
ncbi:MAG TPA: hypothetical protein VF823_10540 [Anaerolineales bacterium]